MAPRIINRVVVFDRPLLMFDFKPERF